MWGYQTQFQISTQSFAESIFDNLDSSLNPRTFLFGVMIEQNDDECPICVEPEDCGYDPSSFLDVLAFSDDMEELDEERLIFLSHPKVHEANLRRIKHRALKNTVQQMIRKYDDSRDVISFCSMPVLLDGFMVCVVLQFDRAAFVTHHSLLRDKVQGRYTIPTSLIDAAIREYFIECEVALRRPEPGTSLGLSDRNYDEIIRTAGNSFMRVPAWAGGELMGLHGLFHSCNTISSIRYEGEEGKGKMLIAQRRHPNIEETITLTSPVKLRNYRAVRKLLAISSKEVCLLCNYDIVYGLGTLKGKYKESAEDLFLISITKHGCWELSHADHTLMKVVHGQPFLPMPPIKKRKFERVIRRIFPDIETKQVRRLWSVISEAVRQKHGTMVVISMGAQSEADRLRTQSTRIEPIQLTPDIMQLITSIDGAVLIDSESICYAIGVILDGMVSTMGAPSRGARYNSAIRYVESSKDPCIAIVVSEDGSIDMVPDLMPQIRRSEIIKRTEKLKELTQEEHFKYREFNVTMSWLSDHRFYLLPDMCNEINGLRQDLEAIRDRVIEPGIVRPVYSDFIPNDKMNDSYFLDDSP